jgi:hypothetical protein
LQFLGALLLLYLGGASPAFDPFQYPKPRPDELSRGIVNGVLCIVLLSASLAAGLSQLVHLKTHADVAPHVSLVMLCVQAVGLSMPLIKGMESLLARATLRSGIATMAPSSSVPSYSLTMNRTYQSIDTAVKVLSLAAFVLTRELIQKVRRSRAVVLARSLPPEPGRVPGEAKVFLYHSAAHLLLFMLIVARNGRTITMEQHLGLMQDLFLLPQAIGNAVWRVNRKPLAEGYYLGVTAARLLPHAYDYYLRPPVVLVTNFMSVNASRCVFSHAGDVVVPAASVLLALVVFVQQSWNNAIARLMGAPEQRKREHIL